MDAGRKIYQRGLVAANDAICPFGWGTTPCGLRPPAFQKGAMTEDMLVNLSGRHRYWRDSEALFGDKNALAHLPGEPVRAVVHAHPPAATARSPQRAFPWTALSSRRLWCSWAPCLCPFALPGSQAVADSVAPYCQAYRAPAAGIPRRGHLGEPPWSRPTTVWNVWNSWPPSPPPADFLGIHRTMPESLVKALEGLGPAWGIQ